MKRPFFLISLFLTFLSSAADAQIFYSTHSDFDATGSSRTVAKKDTSEQTDEYTPPEPYEELVSGKIRERIEPNAAVVLAQPQEVRCYGIARKSPKKRGPTIDGYAHTGNCGALNEVGLQEVQQKLLQETSFDINVTKIASCIVTPRLALRFKQDIDFVDVILSGGSCPGVFFLYGGETKEFSAGPIKEWLDTFIDAVSNDLEPVGSDEEPKEEEKRVFIKRPSSDDSSEAAQTQEPAAPPAPKRWGRQFN